MALDAKRLEYAIRNAARRVGVELVRSRRPAIPAEKVDTQGWDLEVLAGLGGREVVGLQTEVAVQPLYEGSPTLHESLTAIAGLGLTLSRMFPVTLDDRLRLVEFDCVAVR